MIVMDPKPRRQRSVQDLPEVPPELQIEFERIARELAPALKALSKH